jgi:hypothetical protein
MNLKALVVAAIAVAAPLAANAVTFNGSFNPAPPGPATPTLAHNIDNGGFQGDSIMRLDAVDVAGGSFTWTFTATQDLKVRGVGTLRQPGFITTPSVSYNGGAVALVPGVAETDTFAFPTVALTAGDSVTVTLAWAGFTGTGADSSTFTYDIQTSPIPLPAAGWMLVSAIGGMGFLARRRKNA